MEGFPSARAGNWSIACSKESTERNDFITREWASCYHKQQFLSSFIALLQSKLSDVLRFKKSQTTQSQTKRNQQTSPKTPCVTVEYYYTLASSFRSQLHQSHSVNVTAVYENISIFTVQTTSESRLWSLAVRSAAAWGLVSDFRVVLLPCFPPCSFPVPHNQCWRHNLPDHFKLREWESRICWLNAVILYH